MSGSQQRTVVAERRKTMCPFAVFVNGQGGCGKTMLSPILASFPRVEKLTYLYEVEYVCALHYLGRMTLDGAATIVRLMTDLKIYDLMMARETNFRPGDLSSVFSDERPLRYLRRLFQKGDELVPDRIMKENPILHATTHNLLGVAAPIFEGLGERMLWIEVVRHPLYMIKQQTVNMERILGSVRDLTVYFKHRDTSIPFYAYGWEDEFVSLAPAEKAIFMMKNLFKNVDKFVDESPSSVKERILRIPFEDFVLNPHPYVEKIAKYLNEEVSAVTLKAMKTQNVPRKMIAEGIGLKIYRRFGWEPPKTTTEREELNLRREFAKQRVSKSALETLDQISEEYEEKYLKNIL